MKNAKHAVLENAGQISVLKESEEDKVLQTHEIEESWLMENLENKGYTKLKDIVYVEWSEEKSFYILTNDDVCNQTYRIDG